MSRFDVLQKRMLGSANETTPNSSENSAGSGRPKIVVTRDLGSDVMPALLARRDLDVVVWPEDHAADREWLLKNVPGAVGVVVTFTEKVDKQLLDAAGPNLRVVSTVSVGYEHVDISEIAKRGIKFGYTPDVLTAAVADLSVTLALMASRNVGELLTFVQESKWPTISWPLYGLCGHQLGTTTVNNKKTAGFLGFGRISQATLGRLIPFGITDCVYTSNPASAAASSRDEELRKHHSLKSLRRVDLDELARESDVLFVLAPGGRETHHLVNEQFLREMKNTSVLINASRGSLVDSDALAKALKENWIWGAGLDVVEGEPNITAEHPLVKEPRCIVLPHVGSGTFETRIGMATLAVQNLLGGIEDGGNMPAALDLKNGFKL